MSIRRPPNSAFWFRTTSTQQTVELGEQFATVIKDIVQTQSHSVCVAANGFRDRGKTTFLYGIIKAFADADKEEYTGTQVGAGPRVYLKDTANGFVLSYDAYTYCYRNPMGLLKPGMSRKGVICVEHPQYAGLEENGLRADFSIEVVQDSGFDFNSPRRISIQPIAEHLHRLTLNRFLQTASKFSLDCVR